MHDFPAIPQAVQAAVASYGDKPIITDAEGTIMFSELSEIATSIAADLRDRGVGHGDRVLISMTATRWTWATFWAIWKLGAIPVAIGDIAGTSLTETIQTARAKAHVFASERLEKILRAYETDGVPSAALYSNDDCGAFSSFFAAESAPPW